MRGLAALLPTLITLWLLVWAWNFLWSSVGQHIIWGIKWLWLTFSDSGLVPFQPPGQIRRVWNEDHFTTRLVGVLLAILLVYVVGVFVGNLIGRTMWRLAERAVLRVPLVRAIYPAVKQVTDFLLADRSGRGGEGAGGQFAGSRVVAVQARTQGIWSIGLVTGAGYGPLAEAVHGEEMVTVFIPSSPTAFSGYVVVAHRESVVELPLTVEEALRLLVSGGVIAPPSPALPDDASLPPAAAAAPPLPAVLPASGATTAQATGGTHGSAAPDAAA